MLQLLRSTILGSRHAVGRLQPLAVDAGAAVAAQSQLLTGSSSFQLQQQRGAAQKKKAAAKGKTAKKGQQQPAKKQKQKMDSKPFDDKDPLMKKLIAMLAPAAAPTERTGAELHEAKRRAGVYRKQHNRQHQAWSADLRNKLALKTAALQALPPELRAAAMEEDLEPFPLTRHFLYDTPPDAYKS